MAVQSINVPPSLALVLNRAGDRSGVDFDYLLETAVRESSLKPDARASTSSAVGLFQFLEGTWLEVMKAEGPRLGYQAYADAIVQTPDGDFAIPDKKLREKVLSLREEPQVAADLAAAFTRRNGDYLQERFGRMPSSGELYIAHFLGAKGAARMFEAGLSNPDQIAAKLFPRQADANQAIFFSNGQPRTIRQVYKALVAKHGAQPTTQIPATVPAPTVAEQERGPMVAPGQRDLSFTGLFSTKGAAAKAEAPPGNSAFFVQLYNK